MHPITQVCLSWALPSQLENYRIKPLGYLSWLIGHEGRGSLLAYLRKKDSTSVIQIFRTYDFLFYLQSMGIGFG